MASKRNLKKGINFICDNLVGECIAIALYGNKEGQTDAIDDTIASIYNLNADFISRISHPEPGIPQKEYFRVLTKDFMKSVNEVVDNIRNLG